MILNLYYRTVGAIILRISHGYKVKEHSDPFVDLANRALANVSEATVPGAFMVDILPFCKLYYPDVCVGFQRPHYFSGKGPHMVPWCWLQALSK
jgi:hypothetical protein